MASYTTASALPENVYLEQNITDKSELATYVDYAKNSQVYLMHYEKNENNFYFLSLHEELPNCDATLLKKVSKKEIYRTILKGIPANTDEYRHHLCEIIIRFLYGEYADVEKYKIYHGTGKSYDCLCGVDINDFICTEENANAVYYDKVREALRTAKFSNKYGDLYIHDEGESLFKAAIEPKGVLSIYPK